MPLASFCRCRRHPFLLSRASWTPPVVDTAESAADVSPPCHCRQQRHLLPPPPSLTTVASSLPVWRRQKRLRCFYAVDFVVQISLMLSSSLVVVVAARLATITRPMRSVRLTSVASDVTADVSRAFTAPRRDFAEPNVIGEMTVAGGRRLCRTTSSLTSSSSGSSITRRLLGFFVTCDAAAAAAASAAGGDAAFWGELISSTSVNHTVTHYVLVQDCTYVQSTYMYSYKRVLRDTYIQCTCTRTVGPCMHYSDNNISHKFI